MAYESTEVPVSKSQDSIRRLIFGHKGSGLMLISRPPHEGFETFLEIDKIQYHIRIMAKCKDVSLDKYGVKRSAATRERASEQEFRRVWRVLYWHLKAIFEAADSGVIDIRDVVMPYVVLADGSTLSSRVVPRMKELMSMNPEKLLGKGD